MLLFKILRYFVISQYVRLANCLGTCFIRLQNRGPYHFGYAKKQPSTAAEAQCTNHPSEFSLVSDPHLEVEKWRIYAKLTLGNVVELVNAGAASFAAVLLLCTVP